MIRLLVAGTLSLLLLQACSWFKGWGDPEPTDPAPLVDFEQNRHTYIPPEKIYTKSSDIWSIGVTIYILLMDNDPCGGMDHVLDYTYHPIKSYVSKDATILINNMLSI